ncbi:FGGY-family carbohydrate kinase [Paracoccaceae bacterium GXU_MW_L88]
MSAPRHIAVIDVGKTNAKLALVDLRSLEEIAVVTRPNTVLPGPPYPHFDLDGHWQFFLEHLAQFHAEHGVDGISITTHGAAAVLLDADGYLATPMLDYEHSGPDDLTADYDKLRPPFAKTGAPRLPMGLNLGAQFHWLFARDPDLLARTAHIVTYPQYWGYRLTGKLATDVSSLGCHTDLWLPQSGEPSALVETLGIANKLALAHKTSDVLGTITPEIAAATGLPEATPVLCGIHDSNASMLPHLLGRDGAFSVVSTGTWVVVMAAGGETPALDPARDTLINVSAFGDPIPSARFMGGREYEVIRGQGAAEPSAEDRAAVLADEVMLLPAVVPESGPFAGRTARWTQEPPTDGARIYALSLYLALMTDACLSLIGAEGPTVVEGPFAKNADFLQMLAACREGGVEIAASATGTSIGAALLFETDGRHAATTPAQGGETTDLKAYAAAWRAAVS